MNEQFSRANGLLGENAIEKLNTKRVCIFGIGGVGGYVAEALCRCGVGEFLLVDKDTVSESNINRQIVASYDTVDKYKTEIMKSRILSVNKNAKVEVRNEFFLPENSNTFDFTKYDYIVDCVDTVTAKIEIIVKAKEENVPVISAMGAGNKLDITKLKISDIYKTEVDPLAKVMRRELKKRNVESLKVAFSTEEPYNNHIVAVDENGKRIKATPSSMIFVPSAMGLLIASEVVKDLVK